MKINIDELLKQKYNEIECNSDIKLEIKNMKKNNNLYKVASIVLLVVLVAITAKVYNPGQKLIADNDNIDIEENTISDGEQKLEETIPEHQIVIGLKGDASHIGYATSYFTSGIDVKYVLAIKVNKILGYTNYSKRQDKYSIPVTKFEAGVLKCFKGNIDGNIEINTTGGIISLADWEKTLNDEQKEKQGYNKMTQEYKENTYVEIVTSLNLDRAKLEIGKVYLVCLEDDFYLYDGLRTVGEYGMKEYDMSTNSIKENNGKWTCIEDIKTLNDVIKYKP